MCPKVKRYKGKGMGTLFGIERGQKTCLEGDAASEGKVKKSIGSIQATGA
jgi:hypothetical protein